MKRNNRWIVALAVGMLAALSAQAGSGLIKTTHADTPYKGQSQVVPTTVAKSSSTAKATKAPEVQVAVMASAPSQPGARRSVYIHR